MPQDLMLDDDNDLMDAANDWLEIESSEQHQALLLHTNKGEWKESPQVGVGIVGFLEQEDTGGLLSEISQQFIADGMNVEQVVIENGKIQVNATYNS